MENEKGSLLFLYTETPLHAGTGASLGSVDLPIQRERMSGHPIVQGSGIKGALREAFRQPDFKTDKPMWLQLFGPELYDTKRKKEIVDRPETNEETREDFAGAISVQDARLLLLPIRTLWGGFAWVTCPLILERLARDTVHAGTNAPAWTPLLASVSQELGGNGVLVGNTCRVMEREFVVLENEEYQAKKNDALVSALATWLLEHAIPKGTNGEYDYLREGLAQRLVIMADGEFGHWAKNGMEIVTRIAIDSDTGTVKQGALWSEENLPAESLLWAPMYFAHGKKLREDKTKAPEYAPDKLYEYVHKQLDGRRIRLGGDRTVGRGIVAARVAEKGAR